MTGQVSELLRCNLDRLEVADVFHAHQNQFLQHWGHVVSDQQRKVLRDIGRWRTASVGTYLARSPEPVPAALGSCGLGPAAQGTARYRPMPNGVARHSSRTMRSLQL